jgi:hypothetical protein
LTKSSVAQFLNYFEDAPPQAWAGPFAEMAGKCGLSQDLAAAFLRVAEFISGPRQ